MAYPYPFVKVNAEGHFGSSTTNIVERWSAGFHITKNGGVIGGSSEMTAFLSAIRAPLTTFHTTSNLSAGTACYLDSVSGAYLGTDGSYVLGSLQTTTRIGLTTSTPGATGTSTGPWSQAMVLSLRSLLLRGPGSHGRMYWPAISLPVLNTTGVVSSTNVNGILAAATTMINAVNTQASLAFGAGTNVGLVSAKAPGFQSPVVRVGIGQRLDSMESRERDIPEAHAFSATALAASLLEDADDEFRRQFEDLVKNPDRP